MATRLTRMFLTQSANHRPRLCVNCHSASFFGSDKKKKKKAECGTKLRCMYSSQNSALFGTKCCMIDAVLQFWALPGGNPTLRGGKEPAMGRIGAAKDEQKTSKAECQPVPQSGLIVRDLKSASGSWQPWRRQRFPPLRDSSRKKDELGERYPPWVRLLLAGR